MSVVDVHAHVLLPGLQAAVAARDPEGIAAAQALDARRQGPESLAVSGGMIRSRFDRLTVLERRLADMDEAGVDVQVVSPSPSHYYPWADAALADWSAREANRLVAELVAQAPTRLRGLGLVAAQHPELCVDLLDDALGRGLAGVEISSTANGVELSDPRLDPFWARASETGAVLFLHPFGCTLDERIDEHYLSNIVGQPAENAIALSHLIFGGVLDRFPDLRIVAAHAGGYLPTSIGRSDHGWRVRPEARSCEHPPSSYLRRLWFDSLTHSPSQLRALVEVAGADRVLLGSDYPFDMGVEDPVGAAREALDSPVLEAVLGGNAEALLAGPAVPR
ncbi:MULTISPECIES: amidohydrolase family protein [unclassified Rathayibacter]|uniref:amidohydrolase family protein n=1 Tax=unclassified Rathayibacter TaxID=2609250 RepID=UPI000CE71DA4|nr:MULTISPECIES: amidohydrolase family protein [unclassified Rathayibacter]PPI41679.1 amidohydrolase [Rathayibacter sp. RFBD1]PPI63180.1 amidohydrolase [Rathayibacter sp. TRS19]